MLILAVIALLASVWVRDRPLPEGAAPGTVLQRFRTEHAPTRSVDLVAAYETRPELLDPRLVLPAWHRYARAEAAAVANAVKTCPPAPVDVHDAALRKAHDFAKARCEKADLRAFATTAPFMHPSGRSYAALAGTTGALHVLERSDLGLLPHHWVAISHGERLVLTEKSLIAIDVGEHEQRLDYYDRDAWEEATRASAIALEPRKAGAFCTNPASPSLCWNRIDPRRRWLGSVTIGSAAVAALAGIILAFAFVRERRRASADRVHVFRTLTHELRTPAQSLGLDIDLLQSSYDSLPPDAQDSVLRISEGIARLNRVIHRSARYLQLFDGAGSIVKTEKVASVRELFEEMKEEWPEGVLLEAKSEDGRVATDPEWLSVALRNLVENGLRHGKPPVVVTWNVAPSAFVIDVKDEGVSDKNLLRQAAYHHGTKSEGLGLGLAIVQRITERLGGKLTHESSPTTWTLRFPRGET